MATPRVRRSALAASLPLALAAAVAGLPGAAGALSTDVVISAVYGGGGNAGAAFKNDYIELANLTGAPIDVSGWSVQYASAAGSVFQMTNLTGSIPANGRYLVQQAAGSGGTLALPTPDASGSIPMSGTSGVVALVTAQIPLVGCGISCATAPNVKDLVGYGATANVETLAAPGLSNTTAAARSGALTDTDNNSVDFTAGVPKATNSAGTTVSADDPGGPVDPTPGSVRIHDIQGSGRISPIVGQNVTNVPGIVTAVRSTGNSRGFWFQDPSADADPLTSEGLFVFTGSTSPTVAVGDSVLVTGRVTEYRPTAGAQSLTELGGTIAATKLSSGNALPAAVPVAFPDAYTKSGALEAQPLEPSSYVLDWLEVHEGMRVTLAQDTRLVSPVNTEFDELWVTLKPGQNPTPRGGTVYKSYDDPNSGRLMVVSLAGDAPAANVGSTLAAGTTGPVDYQSFGGYVVQATELGAITEGGLKRQKVTKAKGLLDLSIATYNVENLDPSDPDEKFARLAQGVVKNLGSPEILALEEIQDDNGAVDDGTVTDDQTLTKFTAAIKAAGGPAYAFRSIDPNNGTDGGEPGGNIRQAFLYNAAKVQFTDRAGGNADTAVGVVKKWPILDQVALTVSPGRINPTGAAWSTSRKPLVGEFNYLGQPLFVIANHFNSKGGDHPLSAAVQPPVRSSETQRLQQAEEVRAFVQDLSDKSKGKAKVVVLGDLNDYQFSPVLQTVTGNGALLKSLIDELPADQRYSYIYDGNSQTLDHILVSPSIKGYVHGVVHLNAEFADQASDHDPQILRLVAGCELLPWLPRCSPAGLIVDE
ncbi:endonuclease/exonuclease/phosphatase family protein [Actinocorallia aurea]